MSIDLTGRTIDDVIAATITAHAKRFGPSSNIVPLTQDNILLRQGYHAEIIPHSRYRKIAITLSAQIDAEATRQKFSLSEAELDAINKNTNLSLKSHAETIDIYKRITERFQSSSESIVKTEKELGNPAANPTPLFDLSDSPELDKSVKLKEIIGAVHQAYADVTSVQNNGHYHRMRTFEKRDAFLRTFMAYIASRTLPEEEVSWAALSRITTTDNVRTESNFAELQNDIRNGKPLPLGMIEAVMKALKFSSAQIEALYQPNVVRFPTWDVLHKRDEEIQNLDNAQIPVNKFLQMRDVTMAVIAINNETAVRVTLNDLKSSKRMQSVVIPRQYSMYAITMCLPESKRTPTEIGRFFSRDHATAMVSVQKVQEMIKGDAYTIEVMEKLAKRLSLSPEQTKALMTGIPIPGFKTWQDLYPGEEVKHPDTIPVILSSSKEELPSGEGNLAKEKTPLEDASPSVSEDALIERETPDIVNHDINFASIFDVTEKTLVAMNGRPLTRKFLVATEQRYFYAHDFASYATIKLIPVESASFAQISAQIGKAESTLVLAFERVAALVKSQHAPTMKLIGKLSESMGLSHAQRETLQSASATRFRRWSDVESAAKPSEALRLTIEEGMNAGVSNTTPLSPTIKGLTIAQIQTTLLWLYDQQGLGLVSSAELSNRKFSTEATRTLREYIIYTGHRCLPMLKHSLERLGSPMGITGLEAGRMLARVEDKVEKKDPQAMHFLQEVGKILPMTHHQRTLLMTPKAPRVRSWEDLETIVTAQAPSQSLEHP